MFACLSYEMNLMKSDEHSEASSTCLSLAAICDSRICSMQMLFQCRNRRIGDADYRKREDAYEWIHNEQYVIQVIQSEQFS
jgi:hypothetical protein